MKKKFAIVFLSLLLVVSLPFAAHANIVTATGRYIINAVKHAPGGAKVEATNTATGAKHVIKHGVSSADLGKSIGAGIVGIGVASGVGLAFQAITGLALDGVDWVLDPKNNRLIYTPHLPGSPIWYYYNGTNYFTGSMDSVCNQVLSLFKESKSKDPEVMSHNGAVVGATCYGSNPYSIDYGIPPTTPPKKYLPLSTLANKTIELADAGNPEAQRALVVHVTNLAINGNLDNELDNAPDITQPEQPEEPNPEEPQECPSGYVKLDNVCVKIPDSEIEPPTEGDEPLFCDSSEFTKKVCDWIDWTQEEHDEPDAGKVDIIDNAQDLSIDNDRIDFSNQCPAPTPIVTSVLGFPITDEINYQPLCDFFTMLNPFVVGMGGISSALIIAGGARRG